MDNNELFNAPFNLLGEPLTSELDAEGEARVRALAESEARKAQTDFFRSDDEGAITHLNPKPKCSCGYSPCWNGLEQS